MMRKAAVILASLLLSVSAFCQQLDSLEFDRYRGLDSLLTQFYSALELEDVDVKGREMDNLISMCKDSLARQHVALQIFDHYRYSRVMGEEAVAIHVFDEWIASGRIQTRSDFEMMDDELFVNFNRSSLLGMEAARISLFKPCGGRKEIPSEGRVSILFFYDTSCAKCRLETQVLPQVVKDIDFPVDFHAVYVGTDRTSWNAFRKNFKLRNPNIRLVHLWDPEIESGYQKLYGVTGTPKMFVVEPTGTIIGRRLEMTNLIEMIPVMRAVHETYEKYK